MLTKKQELEAKLRKIHELEQRLTFRLHILSKQIDQQAAEMLRDAPINLSAYRFMTTLDSLGECSIADMARFITMDRALASRTAVELERNGFVEFRKDPANRRKKLVALTGEGEAFLARIMPRFEARRARLRDHLGEDMFATLHACLDRLEDAISD